MTDNEKRAHDITVAMLPILHDMNIETAKVTTEPDENNTIQAEFHVYEEYLQTYNSLLKSFNRDFPSRE
jgi:hypothetical protein